MVAQRNIAPDRVFFRTSTSFPRLVRHEKLEGARLVLHVVGTKVLTGSQRNHSQNFKVLNDTVSEGSSGDSH